MAGLNSARASESKTSSPSPTAGGEYGGAEAESLWLRHYGRVASAEKIASEVDAVFRISETGGRKFLLRIVDGEEGTADLQTAILEHIAESAPELPVPRMRKTLLNESVLALQSSQNLPYAAFATTFLPGKPLGNTSSMPHRKWLFRLLAELDRTLADFAHPRARRSILWDVSRADQAELLTCEIPSATLRELAQRALADWRAQAAPRLGHLRRQIIHNDFNPSNILIDEDGGITGIIDFGDAVEAPVVCDLATAIAYQEPQHGFEALLATAVAAFVQGYALTEEEIAMLPVLVRARAAMILAITHRRASQNPGNRNYLLRNVPLAARLLVSAERRSSGVSTPL